MKALKDLIFFTLIALTLVDCNPLKEAASSNTPMTVTPSGSHLTISPSTSQTVTLGKSQSFKVSTDPGFTTASTIGGTCPKGTWNGDIYTTGAILSNCTVIFNAQTSTSQITVTGAHVTLNLSSLPPVNYGSSQSIIVTPDSGFYLSENVGGTCPTGSWTGSTYTTGTIFSACSVSFTANTPIYLYETNNSYTGQNVGSRTTTTHQCQADFAPYSGAISCNHFVALLGYAADNGVTHLEAHFAIPNVPIVSVSGTLIANNLSTLISNDPHYAQMSGPGFASTQVWSGFDKGGGLPSGIGNGGNCSDWSAAGFGGSYAQFIDSSNTGWANLAGTCSNAHASNRYLCMCW